MIEIKTGYESIVERRIREAQEKGEFDNLKCAGKPLSLNDDGQVPEDLKLGYKVLKNAGYLPPEVQLKKDIRTTEDLLEKTGDEAERMRLMKKLNFLTMKLNSSGRGDKCFAVPDNYADKVMDKLETGKKTKNT